MTLEDVAAKAGVSVATASVAITGKPSGNCRVSPGVAEKIRKTARQLKYRPNIQARSLSTQRTQSVAMLVKRSNWHNALYYLASAQRVLRQRGFTEVFLMHQDDQLESERLHLEMCLDRRVEGILIMPLIDMQGKTNARLINEIEEEEHIPIVQLGLSIPDCKAPAIVTDETLGVEQTVRRLYEMGHRDIAHFTLKGYDNPSPLNPFRHAHLRYIGYQRAVQQLKLRERVICPDVTARVETEFDAAVQMAGEIGKPLPTAIVAYSDFEANGLLVGLLKQGINVPQQVSLIGYGDQPFCRMSHPTLSAMAPTYDTIGELATQTLFDMIDGREGQSVQIPPRIILRDSVQSITR